MYVLIFACVYARACEFYTRGYYDRVTLGHGNGKKERKREK